MLNEIQHKQHIFPKHRLHVHSMKTGTETGVLLEKQDESVTPLCVKGGKSKQVWCESSTGVEFTEAENAIAAAAEKGGAGH